MSDQAPQEAFYKFVAYLKKMKPHKWISSLKLLLIFHLVLIDGSKELLYAFKREGLLRSL